ncbi:MAG TPA: hypothetical protein VMW27_15560 [Thermoanaerobaculia bacterium]|nr:hypothetical protein [Thermoanaerobaculia bacterium]
MLQEAWRTGLALTRAGQRLRHPEADLDRLRVEEMDPGSDRTMEPLAVTTLVTDALESLGVPYAVGGSMASSLHGEPRFTRDADLLADLRPEQAAPLVDRLKDVFYVDLEAVLGAIRRKRSFNLIHLATAFKVDVFVSPGRPFERSRLARREEARGPGYRLYVSTAEDVVLAKLEWYREGGGTSDRQWRDILAVLAIQGERLDAGYLRSWASSLGVEDLLERAFAESSGG